MQGALWFLFSCLVVLCATQGPECNGPHEKLQCVSSCPPQKSCRNRFIGVLCAAESTKICQMKCVCDEGYIKNDDDKCIPENSCDDSVRLARSAQDNPATKHKRQISEAAQGETCPGPNEFYQCGPACDNVCASLHEQNRTNCPIVNIRCISKCYCNDGYARDDNWNCIPIEKCSVCIGANEEYACRNTCPPDSCTSLVVRYRCLTEEKCTSRCYCKPGYLRSTDNTCVPLCQCPEMRNSTDCKN